MSTDTMVQRIALCSGNAQTRGAHEGGPRFSEFPRLPTWRCGPGLPLRAEGKDSRNFERPNLKAQASKLSQNRERVHSGWQPFSQVHDAFKRSVPQELSRLSQVVHAQWVETHQAGAHEIGGDGIVGQHDPPEIARRAMQRPVALHADDPIGDDEMRGNSGIDTQDASIDAFPMQ
jgi:hypothetical protein